MILPNLASRPFLNTRPVWLVTLVAAVIAISFAAVDIRMMMASRRDLAEQYSRREQLHSRYRDLEVEVTEHLAALDHVPWRSLSQRVERVNLIMRERTFSWEQLLDDVERVMPYEVRLTRISPKVEEDSFQLSMIAVARSREVMLEFFDNMVADPAFSEPIPLRETGPEGRTSIGYVVTLRVTYAPQARPEGS